MAAHRQWTAAKAGGALLPSSASTRRRGFFRARRSRGAPPSGQARGPAPGGQGTATTCGYEHLNLPMEYEASRVVLPSKIGWKDPRREDGELLHPARFSATTVATLKTTLGSYAYAAQFQQRPTPLEGGMFKRTWWRLYVASPADVLVNAEFAKSKGTYVNACWSWDCTFKDVKTSGGSRAALGRPTGGRPTGGEWKRGGCRFLTGVASNR